ncbi:MAG TPA: protein kinase, partial [Polyangiaceae bacterium]
MSLDRESACLDEQTLAALISGELDASELGVVDAHLANCRDCRCVVGDAAYGAADEPSSDRVAGANVARTVVAEKYRIDGLLGRGGMGVVLSARHIDLGHRVAIKVVSSNDASAAARLLREAKTCAHLESDHIARVFDLGSLPSGLPYFVMEHLVGEDLSKLIARGPVPPALAIEFIIQACSALRTAHAAGVIHRDLKPGNLFVVKRADGKTWLKVLDFGLSKLVPGGSLATSDSLTQSQAILGSPMYMSPEQIRATEVVDARSDIWSIGVILYELLSARRPFGAPAISALLIAITTETPPPLSTLVADLPDGLEAIVMRCLQKDPADRYPSVAALADALHRVAIGGPNSRHGHRLRPASTKGQRRVFAGLALGMLGLGVWSRMGKRSDRRLVASSAAMVQTFKAAPAPLSLRVHCDRPLPTGVQVLMRAEAEPGASGWVRKVPLTA